MKYSEFIERIMPYAEDEFAAFQRKLIFTPRKILGIRTPKLRALAKELPLTVEELFSYPDEYYETVFIKLTVVSTLPYAEFVRYLKPCVALMDNWALCDSFKGKYIRKHKREFLPHLEEIFQTGGEYFERYPLVALLTDYVQEEYIPLVKEYIYRADVSKYYVHMAVAWLVAEILVKCYDEGIKILQEGKLPTKTHDKGIRKAIESYRITKERKDFLRSLKI